MMDQLLQGNEFFTGGLMLAVVGGVIAGLRYLPSAIVNLLQRYFTTTIYIRDGTLVHWVSDWLRETEAGESRWWMGETRSTRDDGEQVLLKPGQGLHVMRRFGVRFLIWSTLEDNAMMGKIHTFTIRCWGRRPEALTKLLNAARDLAKARERGKNVTYLSDHYGDWMQLRLGRQREIESVVLKQGLLEEILADVETFIESLDLYVRRGIPYRRGYLFQGPPGNGKSTLVQALATQFRLPIYSLSIADKDFTDGKLATAVGRIPEKSILLLEDADRIDFSRTSVTMTGLLNSIDGALASEGRILIVTANAPDKLDPAFKREGRMDRTWDIENPDEEAVFRMAMRFYGGDSAFARTEYPLWMLKEFAKRASREGWSMAKVQGKLQARELEAESELEEVGS